MWKRIQVLEKKKGRKKTEYCIYSGFEEFTKSCSKWRFMRYKNELKINHVRYFSTFTVTMFKTWLYKCGCFSTAEIGALVKTEGITDSSKWQSILAQSSVRQLKKKFTFQWNPKHKAISTRRRLQKKMINVLEWPSQNTNLKPIKHLWNDLKRPVHSRSPHSLLDLKHYCEKWWNKIAKPRCATVVDSSKMASTVWQAKGASRNY